MKARNIAIGFLTLAVIVLCIVVVTQRAKERREFEFRIVTDKAIYEASQRGDLQKVQSHSGILLLSDVRYYERKFGAPSATDDWARDFGAAQALAKTIESNLVSLSSILTNLPPGITGITVERH